MTPGRDFANFKDLDGLRVGILGGGQLGWMMILEGRKYPLAFYVLDSPEAPACRVADKCFKLEEYKELVDSVDVVTFEFEHVYGEALRYANEKDKLLPGIESVELKRERWKEREFLRRAGVPTPRYYLAYSVDEVAKLLKNEFNFYGVVKESRLGYDGKGQYFIKSQSDFEKARDYLAKVRDVFVVEEYVDFDYEASIILVRDQRKNFACYPPTYNRNEKGVLVYNYGPLRDGGITAQMAEVAKKIALALDYVGVMAVEFFVKSERVFVNEIAPRVHNTGHYTLDAAHISQFEQHLRAITGLGHGSTELTSCGGMVNVLGLPLESIPIEVLRYGKLYWYGKREVRKRRKMGHINIVDSNVESVKAKVEKVLSILYPNGLDL